MSPLKRFFRFNLVGLLGVVTQLTTLTVLNHAFPRHYLLTSTFAVEFTLLHNFVWHLYYTWPAESQHRTREVWAQLLRFHLSNGLVSLLGNLILMRLFVHAAHTPVLFANALAIACCGLANFLLAHHWVFPRTSTAHDTGKKFRTHQFQ
jgi:putative flippase GtrA